MRWKLAAALTVPSFILAAQLYAGYRLRDIPVAFAGTLAVELLHWEIWALAGPFVWGLERRWPLTPSTRRASLLRHAAAGVWVSILVLLVNIIGYSALVRLPIGWFAGMETSIRTIAIFYAFAYFHVELLIYAGVVAAAYAVRTSGLLRTRERDALRLEAELTNAKLKTLRMQLQPHFLFNTLHTIGSLILQRRQEQAIALVAELGELLRATLAQRDTDLAPLHEEIAYLRKYLKIEEARFGDRLRVEWNIDPAAAGAWVPPFILQPVVENAIRHGVSRREEEGTLTIAAAPEGRSVRITIANDGPPLPDRFSPGDGGGYGLKNVIERLATRTPAGRLELANTANGVTATLLVPPWDPRGAGAV